MSTLAYLVALLFVLTGFSAHAEEKPIKALMITGGCCHDYNTQKYSISEGLNLRLKVPIEWTIVHYKGTPGIPSKKDQRIPFYKNKDWAKGYDIVVHNECFAFERDPEWLEQIIKPHRDGIPAIVMHCTMHSYGFGQVVPWVEFLGVSSPNHGPKYSFLVEKVKEHSDHPITKSIGEGWQTPQGELYRINKVIPSATSLARAKRQKTKENVYDTCIWTNQFGKGRVFGTTVGHHNETVEDPVFQETMARGFLWALDRFDEDLLQDVKPEVLTTAIAQAKSREKKQQQDADKQPTPADGVKKN